MIQFNNLELRNLEEQVLRNTQLLNMLPNGITGTNFKGVFADIQGADTINNNEFALVGSRAPFTLYYKQDDQLVNLGKFPVPGPQGNQGVEGIQGPKGKDGTQIKVGGTAPTTADLYGTLYIDYTTGDLYQYTTKWVLKSNLRGPQGAEGPRGMRGLQGLQGIQGPQGVQGEPGASYHIQGQVNTVEELPNPAIYEAYLVGQGLYLSINNRWTFVGHIIPQDILVLPTTGQSETDTMSQKAITDSLEILNERIDAVDINAAAKGSNGPKPFGELEQFAYETLVNTRLGVSENDLVRATGYTTYFVYFGTNYEAQFPLIFCNSPYTVYIKMVDEDYWYEVTPGGRFFNLDSAASYYVEEVRFTLPTDNADHDFYVSTSPMAAVGSRDAEFTWPNLTPRRRYQTGEVRQEYAGVPVMLEAQNLPCYLQNFEFSAVFFTGYNKLPSGNYMLFIDNNNMPLTIKYQTANNTLYLIQRYNNDEQNDVGTTLKAIALTQTPATPTLTLSFKSTNQSMIISLRSGSMYAEINTANFATPKYNPNGQITRFGISVPGTTQYYMAFNPANCPIWIANVAQSSSMKYYYADTTQPINCSVTLPDLINYIYQLLMTTHKPKIIVYHGTIPSQQLEDVRLFSLLCKSLSIIFTVAGSPSPTIRQYLEENNIPLIDIGNLTTSTPCIAAVIEQQSNYNRYLYEN